MGSKSIFLRKYRSPLAVGQKGLCYYLNFIISNSSLRMRPQDQTWPGRKGFRENVPRLVNDYFHTETKVLEESDFYTFFKITVTGFE